MLLEMSPVRGLFELAVLVLACGLIVYPAWPICEKAGHPGPLSLMILVPFLNVLLLWHLALADWPSLHPAKPKSGPDDLDG